MPGRGVSVVRSKSWYASADAGKAGAAGVLAATTGPGEDRCAQSNASCLRLRLRSKARQRWLEGRAHAHSAESEAIRLGCPISRVERRASVPSSRECRDGVGHCRRERGHRWFTDASGRIAGRHDGHRDMRRHVSVRRDAVVVPVAPGPPPGPLLRGTRRRDIHTPAQHRPKGQVQVTRSGQTLLPI